MVELDRILQETRARGEKLAFQSQHQSRKIDDLESTLSIVDKQVTAGRVTIKNLEEDRRISCQELDASRRQIDADRRKVTEELERVADERFRIEESLTQQIKARDSEMQLLLQKGQATDEMHAHISGEGVGGFELLAGWLVGWLAGWLAGWLDAGPSQSKQMRSKWHQILC